MAKSTKDKMRNFKGGATRDSEENKIDYEGHLSPIVLEVFGEYMNRHRRTKQGLRASDNWQKGIPKDVYAKSLWRHFLNFWKAHRGYKTEESIEDSLCGVLFNAMGYIYECRRDKMDR